MLAMNTSLQSDLTRRANDIKAMAAEIQDEVLNLSDRARQQRLEQVREMYMDWYRECLRLVNGRLLFEFKAEYEGSMFKQRIRHFFQSGWKIYAYYDPEKPRPFIPKWTAGYDRSFREPLERQLNILAEAGI